MLKTRLRSMRHLCSQFRRDEQGSMTVFGLLFFITSCIAGAIAVDISNLYTQRTHLQTAADQAGHAAIYNLWTSGDPASSAKQSEAIQAARRVAQYSLPLARTGGQVADEDIEIEFGSWNSATNAFAPGAGQSAVRVVTSFRGPNAVSAFLFRLAGKDDFDVYAVSIWETYVNGCFTDGFVSHGTLDIASNNQIGGEFCFLSNTAVTKNQNNSWGDFLDKDGGDLDTSLLPEDTPPEPSAIVIMPEDAYDDAVLEGNSGNIGWTDSLAGYGETQLPLLPRMENMMYNELSAITAASSEISSFFDNKMPHPGISDDKIEMPIYTIDPITNTYFAVKPVDLKPGGGRTSTKSLTPLNMKALGMTGPGIYYVSCPNNGTLNIDMDPTNAAYAGEIFIKDMVIMTTCKVDFAQGSVIESGRFIILNDDPNGSLTAASGVTFGKTDSLNEECEDPSFSGVQIYTMGDAKFPASFDAYGMQMVAMGDVQMASGAGGTNSEGPVDFIGSSIISGGDITLTTQMNIKVRCYAVNGDTPNPEFYRMMN